MRRFRRVRAFGAPFPTPGFMDADVVSNLAVVVSAVLALALVLALARVAIGGSPAGGTRVERSAVSASTAAWAGPGPGTQGSAGSTGARSGSSFGGGPPVGPGYQLAAADGGVFSFGNSRHAGSMGAARLAAPVMALADTPDGTGYWEVAAD